MVCNPSILVLHCSEVHACIHVALILSSPVPSSPPFELSASLINSNSFLLSWREPLPEDQNGIIRHYLINVLEENTGREINMTSVATEILLEFLHPFYNYTCIVAAVTVGVGPYSNPITIGIPAARKLTLTSN